MVAHSRKTWLAVVSAIIAPGLGQVYAGNAARGFRCFLAVLLAGLAIPALLVLFGGSLVALLALGVAYLTLWLWVLVDAAFATKRSAAGSPERPAYRWPTYLGFLVMALVVSSVATTTVKALIVEAYRLPAGSMADTLLPGDFVLTTKPGYGARLPFLGTNVSPCQRPGRGDIVVARFPGMTAPFVKRIVGLPGEQFEIRDRIVWISGIPLDETYARFDDTRLRPRSYEDRAILPAGAGNKDNYGPIIIPEGHVFLLGDARDLSDDSRFHGPLDLGKIAGRVRVIYWSSEPGKPLTVRWDRIGRRVQ
jgi:signal peptidase I